MTNTGSYANKRKEIEHGAITCQSRLLSFLEKINTKSHLNCFLEVFAEEAISAAMLCDERFRNGTARPLEGMVIALKDNFCYKDHKVSGSSKILEGFTSLFTSTAVQRLLDQGVIIIGRTNCDEFAMGASNENSAYGPVLNDLDNTLVPGGSSGGSAVAVQAGLCDAALGSDTGGSIRQPASFCGLVGYKPTYGTISRWGLLSYASSFDQIGPITTNVEDAAILTHYMGGPDEYDATMAQHFDGTLPLQPSKKGLKIAYINDCVDHPGLDPEIKASFQSKIQELKDSGHTVDPVDFHYLDFMVPCYYVLTTAEASSNLSRYSGLLYGYRSNAATDLESTFKKSRSEGFGPEVQRRIMLGTFVLSSDFYDAYYTKAQKVRQLIRRKTDEILSQYDYVILPTTSTPAFKLGEKSADPIAMYLADLFTVQANLAGNPAISIPLGINKKTLPFGLQIMASRYKDKELLQFAASIH